MKKLIFVIGCTIFAFGASAQVMLEGTSFGAKAGLNISNFTGDGEFDSKADLYAGALAEYRFSNLFGVSVELVYSRQGMVTPDEAIQSREYMYELDQRTRISKTSIRANYLNIPLMGKLYVLDELSLDFGLQIDILLNAKKVTKTGNQTQKEDIDVFETRGSSLALGASYNIWKSVFLSARYNIGLASICEYFEAKNSVYQLGAGIKF